ncbi:hypothetical protein V1477_006658 [Vespula maculifrons]|uniref:Uncharacterized protein n=1 Tax=Vespula maculifrons TaxID=7453 RepID=A0ABD2CJF6_VESMC
MRALRALGALSYDPGRVALETFFFLCSIETVITRLLLVRSVRKECGRRGLEVPIRMTAVRKIFFSSVPFKPLYLGSYWTDLEVKMWAWRAPRTLFNDPVPVALGDIVSEKKFRVRRALSNDPGRVTLGAIVSDKKIRARRALSNDSCPVLLGAIVSEKKIRARRALSNVSRPVAVGIIVSEKKIVKEKLFFPLCPLNRYNSAAIGPMWTKKIWSLRARGALSNDSGPVLLGAIV